MNKYDLAMEILQKLESEYLINYFAKASSTACVVDARNGILEVLEKYVIVQGSLVD